MPEKNIGIFAPPWRNLKIIVMTIVSLAFIFFLLFSVADERRKHEVDNLEKELARIEQIEPEKYHNEQIQKLREEIHRLKE